MKKTNVKKKASKGKVIRNIVIIVMSIVLVLALAVAGLSMRKYAKGRENIEKAKEQYNPEPIPQDKEEVEVVIDEETGINRDFKKLYEVNSDVLGWLTIPNTKLDLPVVQGSDNAYYLNHTLHKESHPFGVPFADYRATISKDKQSENVSIYGHSAKDGSYFATLQNYKKLDFYKKNPILTFNTIYDNATYKIVGLFMEDVSSGNTKMFAYHNEYDMSEAKFNEYIDNVMKRSYFTTGVDVKYGDKLVTLSTCDYEVNNTDFRVALVARKVRPEESTKVDVSVAQNNANQMMPARWYTKKGIKNPFAQ